ncbi:hypothetical protein ACIQ57_23430 [Lysinibacillus xylanilyticus]|uniref:hypothetical protein n=1 Tax=Lysinibacillus xylanilyticus TaxID=582475 RepID=UPI0037F98541
MYTQPDPIGLAGQNPTLYAYVSEPNFEIDPFGLAKHRGRIQAQGSKLEESVAWNLDTPPTVSEGLAMVDELEAKLSETDRKLRKTEFEKVWKFIENTGNSNRVDAPVSNTYQ